MPRELLGSLRGSPGKQGPPGDKGPDGDKGPIGDMPSNCIENISTAIDSHVKSSTPHPVYDDMIDLVLIFENGLV